MESESSFRSNSSSSQGPPEGTRVVLGRETSPSPGTNTGARISLELSNQFSGQTREVSSLSPLTSVYRAQPECTALQSQLSHGPASPLHSALK